MPTPIPPPGILGIRHAAFFVRDLDASRRFYCQVLGMRIDWEPDPDNLYLTSGSDNLALHRSAVRTDASTPQRLDHFGMALRSAEDVDRWAKHFEESGFILEKKPKTHRDGSRSFYVKDPDGNLIQFIHHDGMK